MEFIDLKRQQDRIATSVRRRIETVLKHGQYILGPEVRELESALAAYVGVRHCISCSSGTDALLLPLMAWGIGPGDAVFTTPFTFIATAEVIALLGATPVFVDIDPKTFTMDPLALNRAVTTVASGRRPSPGSPEGLRPRAVIPVDLFGLPADYDAIVSVAKKYDLLVLEDGAQSFGALYHEKKAGSLAYAAATSFFPAKPLGGYGDGGAVFTDDDTLADLIHSLRVHGQGENKYDNMRIGINGRLDTIQAAVLLSKLDIFDNELVSRRSAAGVYDQLLDGIVDTPFVPEGVQSAWAQYSIVSDERESIMEALRKSGVPSVIYYPKPLHLQKAFSGLAYSQGDFEHSEQTANRIFSLPMHPYITQEEQQTVANLIYGSISRLGRKQ